MKMNKKDVVVLAVLVNAGLLVILLISALTSRESYLVASSAKVASNILAKDDKGMALEELKTDNEDVLNFEGVMHQLPEVSAHENNSDETAVNLSAVQEIPQELENAQNPVATAQEPNHQVDKCINITVKNGDSLEKLARRYHVVISDIQKVNNMSGSFLKKGQNLKIPVKVGSASTVQDAGSRYYTIKPGDNPWVIAMKHHLKVEDLLKMNNLDNRKAKRLKPGDKLKVR